MRYRKLLLILGIIFSLSFSGFAVSSLTVNFIDVGQADCILVQAPNGHNMLIDAGNNEDADTITSYLSRHHVKRIDILVATHPHEDHIGAMDTVVAHYDIGQIYMSKVSTNTRTFENLLLAIQAKGLKVKTSHAGVNLDLDPRVKAEMLAPGSDTYEDLNDYSAVIKLTYGKTSFLLTGDASRISEREMLAHGYDLHADLLKVGHHGSNTSTTGNFLKAVSPSYAVISVGAGNDYGHPGKYTLGRLEKAGIKIYRTDRNGTVVATSDGQKIAMQTEK